VIELGARDLPAEETAVSNLLPTEPGFYAGTIPQTGEPVLVQLKADGLLHGGAGILGNAERYAPYEKLYRESELYSSISPTDEIRVAVKVMRALKEAAEQEYEDEIAKQADRFLDFFKLVLEPGSGFGG